jgi:hypothetical protein
MGQSLAAWSYTAAQPVHRHCSAGGEGSRGRYARQSCRVLAALARSTHSIFDEKKKKKKKKRGYLQ